MSNHFRANGDSIFLVMSSILMGGSRVSSTDEHTFFTHRLVSTFDRVPFQLTDALFSLNRLPLLDEV
jgi:hypothetical protein